MKGFAGAALALVIAGSLTMMPSGQGLGAATIMTGGQVVDGRATATGR